MPVIFSRVNEDIAEKAKKMAEEDMRTVSNLIAYLIEREWERRNRSGNNDQHKQIVEEN